MADEAQATTDAAQAEPAGGDAAEAGAGRRGSGGGYWGMLSAYGRKATAATKTAATQLQKNLPPVGSTHIRWVVVSSFSYVSCRLKW